MKETERVPWERNIRHAEDVNEDNAQRLLFDLLDLLDKHNIIYWLNWGLLLGLVRDGNFIPWDTDMDVTCHWNNRDQIINSIEPQMAEKGCYIPRVEDCFPEDRWFIRDKEKIELNFVVEDGNKYTYSKGRCDLSCPKEYIDTLQIAIFKGRQVYIPSNVRKYLELSYGETWLTPIKGKKPVSL